MIRFTFPHSDWVYKDDQIGDKQYGFGHSNPNREACMKWLSARSKRSVVYVSHGSLVAVEAEQVAGQGKANVASSGVRTSEADKLPKGSVVDNTISSDKCLVVSWCPWIEVLANDAVGCFLTHCGGNSTLEALSLGVPINGSHSTID
ncbi:hypothetical protein TIFTF001_042313 [Ficus carica]|uniref:Uncharacterized protein n=1 Tax=Ficus carica TaxID=3494 RepID=A0AA88CYU6_FICCA|nr:hypothetical protein TIFTF001_042313 [Ficus carica]